MGFVTDIVGEITGANDTADAAKEGSDLQYRASMAGVDEHRRQYDKMVELMAPYVNAGYGALGSQQNLLGLNGNAAQQNAINAIHNLFCVFMVSFILLFYFPCHPRSSSAHEPSLLYLYCYS